MLRLKVLGSSSSGNCYLFDNGKEVLVLDCGIPIKDIKKGLNFDISRIVGVLCSHEHKDHSKALEDFRDMGIHIMAPFEIGDVKRSHCEMGGFDITSFDLPHNGVWNSGFLIKCDGQKILYMTDFEYCPYVFKKQEVNHILIEANHSKELLDREKANYIHSIRGHADIDTTCKFLEVNKAEHLRNVILIHLSSDCGDENTFKKMAESVVDCPVYIAKAGLEIELKENNCPF